MAALRQRNDPVRLLWRRLGLLSMLVLAVVLGASVWHVYNENQESIELKDQAQAQYETLAQQESQLSATVADLQSERGVEAALRQEYGMGAQGERMIEIVEATNSAPVAVASSTIIGWLKGMVSGW